MYMYKGTIWLVSRASRKPLVQHVYICTYMYMYLQWSFPLPVWTWRRRCGQNHQGPSFQSTSQFAAEWKTQIKFGGWAPNWYCKNIKLTRPCTEFKCKVDNTEKLANGLGNEASVQCICDKKPSWYVTVKPHCILTPCSTQFFPNFFHGKFVLCGQACRHYHNNGHGCQEWPNYQWQCSTNNIPEYCKHNCTSQLCIGFTISTYIYSFCG